MSNYIRYFEQNRFVFITVVTFKRNPILTENIELFKKSYKAVKDKYCFENMGLVILPDHFHLLLKPQNIEEYPQIISLLKVQFSKNIDPKYLVPIQTHLTQSKIQKREKGVWQRRYWAHIIWDEKDFQKHFDYKEEIKNCSSS